MKRLALDIEGDGNGPSSIVELAIAELDGFVPTGVYHRWLVKPPGPISRYAIRVHGITDRDVAKAPAFSAVADEVREKLGSFPIVGHNTRGDMVELQRELPDWEPEAGYDTFSLAKKIQPGLESYKLAGLGRTLGLLKQAATMTGGKPHGALFDAVLTALVAHDLLDHLEPEMHAGVLDENNILRHKPRARELPLFGP